MTPVDLNRLREAREDMEFDPDAEYFPESFVELVDAVLDAAMLWWCSVDGCAYDEPVDAVCSPAEPCSDGCHEGVLVPVKGEN